MREAQVLRQIVVGAEAQAGDGVELAVARGEKDDRQLGRHRAQLAAQLEAAFRLVAQADVDDGEIGQARAERVDRFLARAVRAHRIAVALERRRVVVADRGLVFDDGDDFLHAVRAACVWRTV